MPAPSTPSHDDATPAPADSPPVRLYLLGQARWVGRQGVPEPLSRKDAALLARLVIEGPQPKGELCALLWPQASADKAAQSLRQRSSRLNRQAQLAVIQLGKVDGIVRLHPEVVVDAALPLAMDAEAAMHCESLLAGLDFGESDLLDRWLTQARTRMDDARAMLLADHAETLERQERLREALPLAQRIVELQPLAEHGWRRLMRLHYLRNDRAAAQEAFWRLTSLLRDELGIRPSAETLQLMQTVEAADHVHRQSTRPVPASVLRPPVLVGRSGAWQAMSSAWERAEPFLVVAEAGLGKSRLIEGFVEGREGLVIERARPGDEHVPYALLGRTLWQIEQALLPPLPPGERAELARLRPEFGSAPGVPAHAGVLWRAVQLFLQSATSVGLKGLVLDDLHYADPASVEAVRWLVASKELAMLRLGMTTRPWRPEHAATPLIAWLEDAGRPLRIDLEALSREELHELLDSLALPIPLDRSITEQMFRHAGGHPLYTLATLQEALATGVDLQSGPLPRPRSVQALVDARLRHLSPAAQDLLRMAAVAGEDLRADRAARLLQCSLLDLSAPWAELEAANVLRGEAFSHDLVHESALRSVPGGVRLALHRQMAGLLAEDAPSVPARVAWHWEQGEQWGEAGRHWQLAGEAARRTGRLHEQCELFERAAHCHRLAGNAGLRFESLLARLDALQLRHGGKAVLGALPDVEALADTLLRRLRCRLARADACLDIELGSEAATEATTAVQEAQQHPGLRAEALALLAQAQVQCSRFDEALATAHRALEAIPTAENPLHRLHALSAMSYVHYACGRLGEAVTWQLRAMTEAESLDYRTEAISYEGHVAALMASIGDVPATYEHALRTRTRHLDFGFADSSTLGSVNHIVLGNAAAALGRFDEALRALQEAVAIAGPGAAPAAQAKARLALANLWVNLGCLVDASGLLDNLPAGLGPGMQMQVMLTRARVAASAGRSPERLLKELGQLNERHADLPLVVSAHYEGSFSGDPAVTIDRLQRAVREFMSMGLTGSARTLQLREMVRWLEMPGPDAIAHALRLAEHLKPHAATGLSAKCYPPQTWLALSWVFARAGDRASHEDCLTLARQWICSAQTRVPDRYRASFFDANPVNRVLLGDMSMRPGPF